MRYRAEVHCYHCGHESGTWEWLAGQAEYGVFTTAGPARRLARGLLRHIRCRRCQGPVFLDEAAPVVEQPPLVFVPVRRGRPPKPGRPLAS
jgi:hypothetical protein